MDRAWLADGDEAGVELERNARRQHEPARLDADDLGHVRRAKRLRETCGGATQEAAVRKEPERVRVAFEVPEFFDELVVEGRHPGDASLFACTTITITASSPTGAR